MLRLFATLLGVLSTTILLAELVGVTWLWSQGYLTSAKIAEVRHVYRDEAKTAENEEDEEARPIEASRQEVQIARVMRVLNLESRGKELELLKTMTSNTANQLISERKTFDEIKAAFLTELADLRQRHQQESVEQARAVLLASTTDAAVERLMALPLEEAVDLVRGMPEKSIAKILQGFSGGAKDPAATDGKRERGQKIFEALSRGQPVRAVIEAAENKIPVEAADSSPDGG